MKHVSHRNMNCVVARQDIVENSLKVMRDNSFICLTCLLAVNIIGCHLSVLAWLTSPYTALRSLSQVR